jgi:hypothetical protein
MTNGESPLRAGEPIDSVSPLSANCELKGVEAPTGRRFPPPGACYHRPSQPVPLPE